MFKLWNTIIEWLGWRKQDSTLSEELLFAGARGSSRDAMLSFWVDERLYAELRRFGSGRQVSRFLRASVRLGLGVFGEAPELMDRLDRRGGQKHHVTVWVDEAVASRVVVVSGNQQSRFIRASAELGLAVFSVHPDLISTLEGELEE
ncbi:MAG: hypothetical protein HY916_09055 [Desulfovibrio sp.]|jgi:hypothetical protein|nr:hypothetical protein [Desulfovibrio sp.]